MKLLTHAKVLYTDIDLNNIQFGQEILTDQSLIAELCQLLRCYKGLTLLNQSVVTKILESLIGELCIVLLGIQVLLYQIRL